MDTIIKFGVVLLLLFGIVWTLLPWSFGLNNYTKCHGKFLTLAARGSWVMLFLAHPLLIYLICFKHIEYGYPLLCLVIGHITFGKVFGRDVGTA
ncbi:MAG TPA: hypothetical protein VL995_19745 [Cellvibrio sp.]|nr:hypothetical protein [Cellvibrio sp.]